MTARSIDDFNIWEIDSSIETPIQQLERLALKHARKLLRLRGVSDDRIKTILTKIPIYPFISDIGYNAGINLISIWWHDPHTQMKYIKTHRLSPNKIVRRGCSLRLLEWYINKVQPQPLNRIED